LHVYRFTHVYRGTQAHMRNSLYPCAHTRLSAAIDRLDQCGEVFGELALRARLDTSAVNALSDLGLFNMAGAESLRRISPGPQSVGPSR